MKSSRHDVLKLVRQLSTSIHVRANASQLLRYGALLSLPRGQRLRQPRRCCYFSFSTLSIDDYHREHYARAAKSVRQ